MKRIVIIGGGVAGLTAGIYGRLYGYDCTVVEKNSFTGGNLTAWERSGCTVDNCLHWLTGTKRGGKLNDMWKTVGMLGEHVRLVRHESFYTSEYNGQTLSLCRNCDKTLKEMRKLSRDDREECERFIAAVKTVANAKNRRDHASPKYLSVIARYGRISLGQLAKRFRHPLLRRIMTDYLSDELCALALIFAYAAFSTGDADVPAGGSREAAMRMESRFTSLGGRVMTDKEAECVTFNGKRATGVLLKSGELLRADAVICATDTEISFCRLLPKELMPKKLKNAYLDKENMSVFSALHAAFVCDSMEGLPKNTFIIDIPELRIEGRAIRRMIIKPYTNELVNIPEGKTVLQVLFFLYEDESRKFIRLHENAEEYRALKNKFAEAVKRRIVKRYPEIKKSIKTLDVWTPASYQRYFGNACGAFMSFAMKTGKAMFFRLPCKVRGSENVYIASQWQGTPGGLPTAACNGRRAMLEMHRDLPKESKHAFRLYGGVTEV